MTLCFAPDRDADAAAFEKGFWNVKVEQAAKSSTGHVGLRNLGATCYMNSCLQQFFMIHELRAVCLVICFSLGTANGEFGSSVPSALLHPHPSFSRLCVFTSIGDSAPVSVACEILADVGILVSGFAFVRQLWSWNWG